MKRDIIAGAAVRARGESEAERIIRELGAALSFPERAEQLQALKKGD